MKRSNILWGVFLIILGVILGINATGLVKINIFFDGWWTLFLIVPSLINLISGEDRTTNFIMFIIGIVLLLGCRGIIDFSLIFKLIVPFSLVIAGLSFIFKDSINYKIKKEIKNIAKNDKDNQEYYATFSEQKLNFANEKVKNSNLYSIFGSLKLDLTNAEFNKETIINATSIFGGIDIIVPKDIKIKIVSNSIFGGVENHFNSNEDAKKTLYINATCIFGGIDIK